MTEPTAFKLTYSTMFDPPPELHRHFEAALAAVKDVLGAERPMWIGGAEVLADAKFEVRSPINRDWHIGTFQQAEVAQVDAAVAAARHAFPGWAATPWRERVKLLRRAGQLIEERVYEIGAAVALEVGKNRMEALGGILGEISLRLAPKLYSLAP